MKRSHFSVSNQHMRAEENFFARAELVKFQEKPLSCRLDTDLGGIELKKTGSVSWV